MGLTPMDKYLKEQCELTNWQILLMTNKEKVAFKANWERDVRKFLQENPMPEPWPLYLPVCPTHKIVLKTK